MIGPLKRLWSYLPDRADASVLQVSLGRLATMGLRRAGIMHSASAAVDMRCQHVSELIERYLLKIQ